MKSKAVPNIVLMGLESKTRADYEQALGDWHHADRLPEFETLAVHETPGLRFVVVYHPLRSWVYEFTGPEGGLRGKFDCRESCLTALTQHMAVRSDL